MRKTDPSSDDPWTEEDFAEYLAHPAVKFAVIGEGKLRSLIDEHPHEDFYVMNGNRALIKREKFERYLDQATAV